MLFGGMNLGGFWYGLCMFCGYFFPSQVCPTQRYESAQYLTCWLFCAQKLGKGTGVGDGPILLTTSYRTLVNRNHPGLSTGTSRFSLDFSSGLKELSLQQPTL